VSDGEAPRPVALRVLRGTPSDEELAALVSVLAASASAGRARPAAERPRVGGWADRRAALRTPVSVGPGAWAASGRARGTRTRADW
jgi:hypothetical protein